MPCLRAVSEQPPSEPVASPVPLSSSLPMSSDLGSAVVTLALSINITSNGIHATSRCSSPAGQASLPLRLSLGEPRGFNSLPSSQPPTPQANGPCDLADLQHRLTASLNGPAPAHSPPVKEPIKEQKEPVKDGAGKEATPEAHEDVEPRPRKIDIHDLETELSKLHSSHYATVSTPIPIPVTTAPAATPTGPSPVSSPPAVSPVKTAPSRKISRFSVSVVDEKSVPEPSGPAVSPVPEDPELRALLRRHESERRELATRHERELEEFHARRKQQQQEQQQPERKPVPSPAASPPQGEKAAQPPASNPGSSPGTPTRQTKTFTDDLLRLVQDLGNKSLAEKNKKPDAVEKAPTLNQLRAASQQPSATVPPVTSPSYQLQQGHSLTHAAGTLPSADNA